MWLYYLTLITEWRTTLWPWPERATASASSLSFGLGTRKESSEAAKSRSRSEFPCGHVGVCAAAVAPPHRHCCRRRAAAAATADIPPVNVAIEFRECTVSIVGLCAATAVSSRMMIQH